MNGIEGSQDVDDQVNTSTIARMRGVLRIVPFRRLWTATALCATADWLSLLALTALATHMTSGAAQGFALGGVVATRLLPAMVLAPLAGLLADKLDRRKVMVVCDVLRGLLYLSIPLVGSLWWVFVAVLLIELCALFWIPAKDAAVPNLLHRRDQVETANQLGLILTYGAAVLLASILFSGLSKLGPALSAAGLAPTLAFSAYFALGLSGIAYAISAAVVALRVPEISGRAGGGQAPQPSLPRMLGDGLSFVGRTKLVRGLVLGVFGAFAAGGAVVASARLYATNLGGGDAAYGVLFGAMFTGLGIGMLLAPRIARTLSHDRLFGVAIGGSGLCLVLVALAPHLFVALAAVVMVGCGAGMAFLTALTIIGARVDDGVRGRVVGFTQALMRLTLLGSMALVPMLISVVPATRWELFGRSLLVDGTRPVLVGAGIVATLMGMIAYRQMVLGRGADRRRVERTGPLVLIEAVAAAEATAHAAALADRLSVSHGGVAVETEPGERRPDLTVVLADGDGTGASSAARADPERYLLVDAHGDFETVAERVHAAVSAGLARTSPAGGQ